MKCEPLGIGELLYMRNVPFSDVKDILYRMQEYGPDGFGIANLNDFSEIIRVMDIREIGAKILNYDALHSLIILRYAIYGRPSIANTPPFFDCNKKILVVARGAIREADEKRRNLMRDGHLIIGRDISAIIAHYVEEEKNFEEALKKLYMDLDGYYSAYIYNVEKKLLGVVIKGPFEFIGFNERENKVVLASEPDVPHKLLGEVIGLADGIYLLEGVSLKVIAGSTYQLEFREGRVIGGKDYHMEREMLESSEIIKLQDIAQSSRYLSIAAELIRDSKEIFYIGSGSSFHASLYGAYLLNDVSDIKPNVQNATEFIFFMLKKVSPGDVIIATSQSGKTRDVIHAVSQGRLRGALIIGILNSLGTPLMYASNVYIPLAAGPEVAVPATKTFIAQLATHVRLVAHVVGGNFQKLIENELKMISNHIRSVINDNRALINKFAEETYRYDNFFVLGRGLSFPIALEGALKLKEVSHIHAEGMDAGEFRHGSKTLIKKGIPVIVLMPQDIDVREDTYNLVNELRDNTEILVITDNEDRFAEKFSNYFIKVPKIANELIPILYTVVLQLIAFEIGKRRKMPIDNPPQLSKFVVRDDFGP